MVGGPVVGAGLGVAAVAHVNSSYNNTKVLISDVQGNAISWSSAGTMGFKGSRKCTPYAAQMAAEDAGRKAYAHGVKTLEVEVHGPGAGRESALRALAAVGFSITSIRDVACPMTGKSDQISARSMSYKKDAG
ncbi:30S ribosomal protein S11 [Phaeobacter sp. JH20_41]|uniref:30S ribosomal protein S11 n=1 Tax=Phaeobacter sp. JH20_41 TaxID=3112498 RepID=UPI003A85FA39